MPEDVPFSAIANKQKIENDQTICYTLHWSVGRRMNASDPSEEFVFICKDVICIIKRGGVYLEYFRMH